MTHKGAGAASRVAPDVGLDQLDNKFDLPLELPMLVEGARLSPRCVVACHRYSTAATGAKAGCALDRSRCAGLVRAL